MRQTAPIFADMSQAYDSFDWQTSRSMMDISQSTPFEFDKSAFENSNSDEYDEYTNGNVYDYTVQRLDGQEVCLREYAGQVLIIVNYASTCGFTYDNVCNLSELSEKYGRRGLTILMFPSNDFFQNIGGNTAAEILAQSHPEFEVFSQICVNGKDTHPFYRFLKNKLPGAFKSKDGCPVKRYSANDSFQDIEEFIQQLLMDQSCKCDD
ncbi:putative phospholipid hydroperoxide glutathione peroxidase [Aphis craccivora]|uniref:Glutathione peroxidase n=1 Tax=Aphis craccivora TaxID=307492 RepID=A0A6G0Z6N0_APHCR|nr:putative phospholipid hydroperoxide glutathione peroxidase [Aphis craccivora]